VDDIAHGVAYTVLDLSRAWYELWLRAAYDVAFPVWHRVMVGFPLAVVCGLVFRDRPGDGAEQDEAA
jgi:hypothetical protein